MFRVGNAVCLALLAAAGHAAVPAGEAASMPLIEYAEQRLRQIDGGIRDYTCTLIMRERVDKDLSKQKQTLVKLRHEQRRDGAVVVPFSVYLRFFEPAEIRDREVIYVRGRNQEKLIARRGGRHFKNITIALDPLSELATRDIRYSVTEMGIRNLVERLLEAGRDELGFGEIEVKYLPNAKVNGRVCTLVQVKHPTKRDHFRYHLAQIFIDDKLQLPIRYAAYDWPEEEGGVPRLTEEYTYLDLKLNVGLTDTDFDHRNPDYGFQKDFEP